jgi:hypothetical protein
MFFVYSRKRRDCGHVVPRRTGRHHTVERQEREPAFGIGTGNVVVGRTGVEQEATQVGPHPAIVLRAGAAVRREGPCDRKG